MKLRFDPSLPHQHEAVQAVVDLLDGMPLANSSFSFSTTGMLGQSSYTELGVVNNLSLPHETLVRNLHVVQQRNRIQQSPIVNQPRFSIEMETGTGKTYVYLRTMFELHKLYGMKKFVIVVPSIAIREGVLHSISTMRTHFESLYDVRFEHFVYDSSRLAAIRSFATSDMMQIMVINIQAFIKDAEAKDTGRGAGNVIYREYDKLNGYAPMDFIAATSPIVVVDEPQKASSSEKQKAAVGRLKPSLVLEYSATHKDAQHLLYRLGPIDAYEQDLVKQIEVASVLDEEENVNAAYVAFVKSDIAKQRTQIEITHGTITAPKRKKIWVKQGDDLANLSPNRPEYAQGFLVSILRWQPGNEFVEFGNGRLVKPEEGLGDNRDAIMRAQMATAIEQHLDRELLLVPKGIKVLSLFFIDRVANYREYDADGNAQPGKFAKWFEEIYARVRAENSRFQNLNHGPVERLHDGYFSIDKQKRAKDTRGDTKDDEPTYELIMRDKERLLSLDEPLRFIFSHSALREGWDNPNVFQICTMNETNAVVQKRQEIGRGLRLPVNQEGERIHDRTINRLTVIANESYKTFAETLQKEYEEEAGVKFGRVERTTFNNILDPARIGDKDAAGEPITIGQQASNRVFEYLKTAGFIDHEGRIQDLYNPNQLGFVDYFTARMPEEFRDDDSVARIQAEINKRIFQGRHVKPARKMAVLVPNNKVLDDDRFIAFWNTIAKKTRYLVEFDSERLISACVESIANMPNIVAPKIKVEVAQIEQSRAGIREQNPHYVDWIGGMAAPVLPDIITMIQSELNLTRKTVSRILVESGKLDQFAVNPQAYITAVTVIIKMHRDSCLMDGLRYELLENEQVWQVRDFARHAPSAIVDDSLYQPQGGQERTVYDFIPTDSGTELNFVQAMDADKRVKYFVKLPDWFKVDTPIGTYNPDWAIMFEDEKSFYLVRETKSTTAELNRRGSENLKIQAARAHYRAIDVNYDDVTSWSEVMESILKD